MLCLRFTQRDYHSPRDHGEISHSHGSDTSTGRQVRCKCCVLDGSVNELRERADTGQALECRVHQRLSRAPVPRAAHVPCTLLAIFVSIAAGLRHHTIECSLGLESGRGASRTDRRESDITEDDLSGALLLEEGRPARVQNELG
eukprot:2870752-Prymnesium_polylepis.1